MANLGRVLTFGSPNVAAGLRALGVDAEEVSEIPRLTTEVSAVFFTGDYAVSDLGEREDIFGKMRVQCSQLEIPMIFDPNLNAVEPEKHNIIEGLSFSSDIFIPSVEEAAALCRLDDPEKIARHYLDWGTGKIVVKLDKNGAYFQSGKESGYAPTFRADKVVDTHGAGNAFAAGLISGIIEDIPLSESVIRANACGSIAIQSEGDCFPTIEQIREYMLGHRFVVEGCKEY